MALNNIGSDSPVWSKMQRAAATAEKIVSTVDSAIGTLDSVRKAISKFHFVSPDFSHVTGQLRCFKIIVLPLKVKDLFLEAVKLANGKESSDKVVSIATIVATLGDIADAASTFIGALDKVTKLAATVNAVAQWLGVVGSIVSAAITVPLESYFINKGVSVLKDLKSSNTDDMESAAFKANILALSILDQDQLDTLSGDEHKAGVTTHLTKRVHFDISLRAIAITLAILTIAAVCIGTFGVGAVVIAVGATISATLAVTSLLLIPIKEIVKNEFDKEFKVILEQ